MSFFLLAFLAGLGVICSLAGWVWALTRDLRLRRDAGFGICVASSLALSTSADGILLRRLMERLRQSGARAVAGDPPPPRLTECVSQRLHGR